MNISEPILCNNSIYCSQISPNGKYLACASGSLLAVHNLSTGSAHHRYQCNNKITLMKWSPDSALVLCLLKSEASSLQVFSLEAPSWRCLVEDDAGAIVWVRWAPDARHLVTTGTLNCWATIWSLTERKVRVIKLAKGPPPLIEFSPDNNLLAVTEWRQSCDVIQIFSSSNWHLKLTLEVNFGDIAGLAWSGDSDALALWQQFPGSKLRVVTLAGDALASRNMGTLINQVVWNGDMLFVLCGNNSMSVLNTFTWNVMSQFNHIQEVSQLPSCKVLKEVDGQWSKAHHRLSAVKKSAAHKLPTDACEGNSYKLVADYPVTLPSSPEASPLKRGVYEACPSGDGRYLATRSFSTPRCVYVWSILDLSLSTILIHSNNITNVAWDSSCNRLAITTSKQSYPTMFFWTPNDVKTIPMPYFGYESIIDVQWNPCSSLKSFIVSTATKTLICHSID